MLNMDFSQPVSIDTTALDWIASPKAGVWRKPLAREEAERGHATSLVRYDAGASFPAHNHPLGEEILVLEGTFSDASGDFPAGTYFRNPIGFRHAPFSEQGCLILVKLHQFQPDDDKRLAIDSSHSRWQQRADGSRELRLHQHHTERVVLLELGVGDSWQQSAEEPGLELYLLAGSIRIDQDGYSAGTWLRRPAGALYRISATSPARLWIKTGHLR